MSPEERPISSAELNSLHESVFRNTANDPQWLGFLIQQFLECEGLSRAEFAAQLGIEMDALVLLCLCRTPRAERFTEDLREVCARTGAREEVVARVVRQQQALLTWRERHSATAAGWLLAASDRKDDAEMKSSTEKPQGDHS